MKPASNIIVRISILALFFMKGIATNASPYPDSLLFKSFSKQCLAIDSLRSGFTESDTISIKKKLNDLQNWAAKKGDNQLKNLYLMATYRQSLVSHFIIQGLQQKIDTLIDEFSDIEQQYLKAEALQLLAEYYWLQSNHSAAMENYHYAYRMYEEWNAKNFPHKGDFLFDIGGKFYYFRDFKAAKKYFIECLSIVPDNLVDNRTSKTNTLAMCYRLLESYDSAMYYFNKANEMAIAKHDSIWVGIISGNIAWTLFSKNDYEKARPLFEQNIAWDLKYREYMDAAYSMAALIPILLSKNENKKALEYAILAYGIMLEQGKTQDAYSKKIMYPSLAKAWYANGYKDKAFAFMDSAAIAMDSVFKQRNALVLSGVQHKLDHEEHLIDMQKKEAEVSREKLLRNSFITGFAFMLAFAVIFFRQRNRIAKERKRSESLLLNILPGETAQELKDTGVAKAKRFEQVTVMFTDFKNFTATSEKLSPEELVKEIHFCYSRFDGIIARYGIEKIKTIGDSYMCAAGLPVPSNTHAADMLKAALEIRDFIRHEKNARKAAGLPFFEIRIGVHSGPVVAGIVGIRKFAYDIWGDTVNVASRMESHGEVDKVNISGATFNLIHDLFNCIHRGQLHAKNKGEIDMYFVEG